MRWESVDLSSLANELAADLKQREPERKAGFVIQEGVKTRGDARLLRIALQNLLGNAWKFTSREPEAKIEFGISKGAAVEPPAQVYYVKDNGAGFDMSYNSKLFGAFSAVTRAE